MSRSRMRVQDADGGGERPGAHGDQAGPGAADRIEPEREQRDAVDAELDHHAGQERGSVGRRDRVRLGQPDVQRDEPGLEPEPGQGEQEGRGQPAMADQVRAGRDRVQGRGVRLGGEDHERGDDQQEADLGQGEEPERAAGRIVATGVAQDEQVARQAHGLPGDEERDHAARGQDGQAGEQGQVEGGQVDRGAAARLVVAGRVPGDRHRDDAEQRHEHARQAGHLKLQGSAGDRLGRAAGRHHRGIAVDQ